jgi:RND family efflux transporter MFP subunit
MMKYILSVILILLIACTRQSSELDHDDHQSAGTEEVIADSHEHEHSDEADHSEEAEGTHEELPDSAGYTLLTLKKQPFVFTLRTAGRIMVDSRDVVIVTAKSSGLVNMTNDYLFPGVKIFRDDILFTISGAQLAEDNTELNFMQVKADLDRASVNYDRAQKLIADRIITEDHFLTVKNEYEKLLNEYDNLNATTGRNGNMVKAAWSGYIKEIFVTEGQKVTAGQQLASIVTEHNLVLKADVSPNYLNVLSSIQSANFTVGYSKKLYRISEMNGRKISQGKSTGENSYYIPVYFRMDYLPELIEGTFAEIYLVGKEIPDAIVIPNTALMEEFGKLYVFVAHDDGDFIKRYIETGNSDGEKTMVSAGLSENETVVATGTYRVKLSQTVTVAPDPHNH